MIEPFAPGVGDKSFIDDGGIGIIYGQKFQAHFGGELIAVIAFEGVGRAGGESCAIVFFLIGVAAEVIFLFEQQPVFAAQKIAGGKSRDAAADDDDVGFAVAVGTLELRGRRAPGGRFRNVRLRRAVWWTDFSSGTASRLASMGQPAATDPATTYLMKLRRECDMKAPLF